MLYGFGKKAQEAIKVSEICKTAGSNEVAFTVF